MNKNHPYYKAIALSEKVWIWLYKYPDKSKRDSPYWEVIKTYEGHCPLCQYFYESNISTCVHCILYNKGACQSKFLIRYLITNKHVAFFRAYRSNTENWLTSCRLYTTKIARAFIASKLRRERRRLDKLIGGNYE